MPLKHNTQWLWQGGKSVLLASFDTSSHIQTRPLWNYRCWSCLQLLPVVLGSRLIKGLNDCIIYAPLRTFQHLLQNVCQTFMQQNAESIWTGCWVVESVKHFSMLNQILVSFQQNRFKIDCFCLVCLLRVELQLKPRWLRLSQCPFSNLECHQR